MNSVKLVDDLKNIVTIAWEISDRCNYSCWYCPSRLHANSLAFPQFKNSLAFLTELANQNELVYVDLVGGEPTLWPNLIPLIENSPKNVVYELVTNGSRTIKWWKRYHTKIQNICVSVHFDSCDDNHLMEVFDLLKDQQCGALLLYDPKHLDRIHQMSAYLQKLRINHKAKIIYPNFEKKMLNYTSDQLEDIKKIDYSYSKTYKPVLDIVINGKKYNTVLEVMADSVNKFTRWKCKVGSKRFQIDLYGNVYAGSCAAQLLGNINNTWKILTDPLTCEQNICVCMDDIRVEKWLENK